jgi:hypothetical protein
VAFKAGYKSDKAIDSRKLRIEIVVSALLFIGAAALFTMVFIDIRGHKTEIDNTKNEVLTKQIESTGYTFETYTQNDYALDLPKGWKKINSPEIIIDSQRYYPDRFQGVDEAHVGRQLDVYVNRIPANLPLTKALEVKVKDENILPLSLSGQCLNFTDVPKGGESSNYQTEWQGHKFLCRPSRIVNKIVAIENDVVDGITLNNETKTVSFLIIYQDHGSNEDNSLFFYILESFKLN